MTWRKTGALALFYILFGVGNVGAQTSGNDFFFFNGTTQSVSMTITNRYTGETVFINGVLNLTTNIYDGMAGFDTILCSDFGDYLRIRNGTTQWVASLEMFILGDGADVLDLSDTEFVLGDAIISGGAGADILWGNAGNDQIFGADGNDILNGGPGNDEIYGNAHDDLFYFSYGSGSDTNYGGDGFDEIVFRSGIALSNLVITPLYSTNLSFAIVVGTNGDHITCETVEQLRFSDNSTVSLEAPAIVSQPQSLTNIAGTPATFSVTATNGTPFGYQWRKNGADIPGATNSSYTIASTLTNDAGSYLVIITNNYWSVTSDVAVLTVNYGATVKFGTTNNDTMIFQGSLQQVTTTITNAYTGETLFIDTQLNVSPYVYDGLAGTDTLVYGGNPDGFFITNGMGAQMLFNVERISAGSGDDIFNLSHPTIVLGDMLIDAGRGNDVIWANAGNDLVNGFDGNDIINGGPGNDIIQGQNDDDTLTGATGNDTVDGGNGNDHILFSFGHGSDTVTGSDDFDEIVFGAGIALSNLVITPLGYTNLTFDIVVGTNGDHIACNTVEQLRFADGSTVSLEAPGIGLQPQSLTNAVGTLATFSVTVTNGLPVAYQWRKDGTNIAGATTNSYTIASVQTNDAGSYLVVITNNYWSVTSAVATLTIGVLPTITAQPQSTTNFVGTSAMFIVVANGTGPLSYQWLRTGTNLFDGGNISGVTTTNLVLSNVQTNDAGNYSVMVTNLYGSVTSVLATLTVLPPVETGTNLVWTNTLGGNWHVAANWSPNQVPGHLDSATIALGVTMTANSPAVVSNLTFSGTAFSGSGVVTVNGAMHWNSGTIAGALTIAPTGQLNLTNASIHLISGAITNLGTVVWSAGTIYGDPNAVIHNEGLWSAQADGQIVVNTGTGQNFINLGTFEKTGGTGSTTIAWNFNSTGIIDTQSGRLSPNWTGDNVLHGTLNWTPGSLNAGVTLTIATNGTLDLVSGGTYVITGMLTNRGTVTWPAGTIYGDPNAVIHNAGSWLAQADNQIVVNTGTGQNFINTGTLHKTGGTGSSSIAWNFTSTGEIETLTGSLNIGSWVGNSTLNGILKGSQTVKPGASLTLATNSALIWVSGNMDGVLTVAPGSSLSLTNAGTFTIGGAITNEGAVVWSAGTIYGDPNAVIHNEGLWSAQADGQIVVNTGTGQNFVNLGTVEKTAGTGSTTIAWNFNSTGTIDTQSGRLSPSWTGNNVLHGTLNWTPGSLGAGVTLTIATNGTLNLASSGTYVISGMLTNEGTVTCPAGTIYGDPNAIIHNAGSWLAQADNQIVVNTGTGQNFINSGTFQKTGGTGSTSIGWSFHTSGEVNLLAGTLALTSVGEQSGGATRLTTGKLQVSQPFQLLSGVLAGTNIVTGTVVNNGGIVSPGASPGTLIISGNYTQATGGTLVIELGGYVAGTSHDRLVVGGTAQLDGTLSMTLTNGFTPTNNGVFTYLTAASRTGSFTSFDYPSNSVTLALIYTATNASVQVSSSTTAAPPVLVFGPALSGGDFVARFLGTTGATYTIERTPILSPASWLKLTNLFAPPTNAGFGVGVFELRDPINASTNRFYRAVHPAY